METHRDTAAVMDGDTCYLNGLLQLRAGQPAEASDLLQRALQRRPDSIDVRRNLIRALLASERYAAVLDQTTIALAGTPDDAELYFARGTALAELRQPLAARDALTRSVVLRPSLAAGWLNLGNICVDLDQNGEAERHYRTAIRLNPALAQAYASLGHLLLGQGRVADAIAACEAAVRLAPAMAEAHWNLASALLLSGDMARGWRAFEWRKRHPRFRADFPPLPGPYWSGEDPAGKLILVRAEQGLGDTIQFARYLPVIAARGGIAIVACDPRLVPLLSTMHGVIAVPRSAEVPYDAWIDMMSLPLALGGIPYRGGYLRPPPAHRGGAPLRVGLAWAGNPANSQDRRRSIPAAVARQDGCGVRQPSGRAARN
jgi:Flp pilus assembly protein TadD